MGSLLGDPQCSLLSSGAGSGESGDVRRRRGNVCILLERGAERHHLQRDGQPLLRVGAAGRASNEGSQRLREVL